MPQLIDVKQDFDLGNKYALDCATELSKLLDDDYRIIVKYDMQLYDFPDDDKKNIVFALSRETHDYPRYLDDPRSYLFFHNYAPLDNWGHQILHPKICPFPPGIFINDIDKLIPEIKPYHEREYDFCFVGQLPHTGTRDKFKRCLDRMLEETGNKFKSYVKYTENFGSGLDHKEYLEVLNNSKICLCPPGASSNETFRFFEAIAMGSFPLVELLPKFWYYETAPTFFGQWEFLDNILSKSLNFLNSDQDGQPFFSLMNYNNALLTPANMAVTLSSIVDLRNKLNDEQLHSNQL